MTGELLVRLVWVRERVGEEMEWGMKRIWKAGNVVGFRGVGIGDIEEERAWNLSL